MAQKGVECLIGRLVTDRAMREWFENDREAVLSSVRSQGYELNEFEKEVLLGLDIQALERFAIGVDGGIQRAALGPLSLDPHAANEGSRANAEER